MRHPLLIVAAVTLAACAGRSEDETAAAPGPGDTTAVTHAIDSTRTGPPGVAGRPGDATVTPDSVLEDTAGVARDTMNVTGGGPVSTPQDTLGPSVPDTIGQSDTTGNR